MYEQELLGEQVRQWESEGRWIDRGCCTRGRNGTIEYLPTKSEIAATCQLFRTIPGWEGAAKRAPRDGEYAAWPLLTVWHSIVTTAEQSVLEMHVPRLGLSRRASIGPCTRTRPYATDDSGSGREVEAASDEPSEPG